MILLFTYLLAVLIANNGHVLAGMYFIFLKNVLDHTSKDFNNKNFDFRE